MKVTVEDEFKRIDADLLIPGRGDPIKDATLIYSGSSIVFSDARFRLPSKFNHLQPVRVSVLMPGMWDCHVHFFGSDKYSVDALVQTNQVVAGIRSTRDALATLNAGFTSVRELAGHGYHLAQVINEGWIPGPNIYSSISILSQTAGHGDPRSMSLTNVWDAIEAGMPCYLCDGPVECVKAVRVQIRRGASLIKIAASGGVASIGDDITLPQFDHEEITAMVNEATRNRMIVAAHCHARSSVKAALDAGVRTIEHGTFLDQELVELMLEKDAMLIATRTMLEFALQDPHSWTPEQYAQLRDVQKHGLQSYRLAIKAGVRCALGTDLGVSAHNSLDWNFGRNGAEFQYAVEAGMTALQAIESGTANAPATLGPRAPKSGQLVEGYDADFIALGDNPLNDITVLSQPDKILHVWKGGKMYKKDGKMVDWLGL